MNPYYNNPYGQYYQQPQQQPEKQGPNAGQVIGQVAKAVAPMALNAVAPGLGTVAGMGMNMLFPYGGQYPQGGQYGAPVQDPQRQQMMPDLAQFNGPSHEEGGINLNGAAEIEKQETVDTNNKQVYSDTLIVPGTKKKGKKGKTFAEVSKKYQNKPSDDEITRRTNAKKLEDLSKQQDQVKAEKATKLQGEMDALGLDQGQPVAQPQPGMDPSMMQMPGAQMPTQEAMPQAMPMPQEGMQQFPDGGIYAHADPNSKSIMLGGDARGENMTASGNAVLSPYFKQFSGNMGYKLAPGLNANAGVQYSKDHMGSQINPNIGLNYQSGNFSANANYDINNKYPTLGASIKFREGGEYYTPAEAAANGAQLTSNGTMYGSAPGNYGNGRVQYPNGNPSNEPYASNQPSWLTTSISGKPYYQYSQLGLTPPIDVTIPKENYTYDNGLSDTITKGDDTITPVSTPMSAPSQTYSYDDGLDTGISKSTFTPSFENDYGVDVGAEGWEDAYLARQAEYGGQPNTIGTYDGTTEDVADTTTTPGTQQGSLLGTLGSLAPVGYNLAMGMQRPDYYEATYNPEYDKSIELMSDRRYDIDPHMKAIQGNLSGTRKAITGSGVDAGTQIRSLMGAQMASDQQMDKVLAQKENMDNQYMAQEAQFRGQMGGQKAAEDSKTQLYGLQTDAARRAFLGEGFKEIGEFAQVNQQMANQGMRDDQRMAILHKMYGHFPQFAQWASEVGLA